MKSLGPVLLFGFLISGCGGDKPNAASSPSVQSAAAPTEPVAAPLPKPEGGNSSDAGLPGNVSHAPSLRQGAVGVDGELSVDAVQRVVRQRFGGFRKCYEEGLTRDKVLSGTLAVHFEISTDGHTGSLTKDAATDLKDDKVIACVLQGFSALAFPQLKKKVTVTYPIIFTP